MKKLFGILCTGGLLAVGLPTMTAAQDMHVRDFVHEIYVEGVPYEKANAFDAEAVPILLEMLADRDESPYWANVTVTLCIIGDESAVDPLIEFIKKDDGTISDEVYRAKSSTVMALGYLINKTGNETALTYLIDSLDPQAWTRRGVRYRGRFQASTEARDTQLSTMAMLGLALSGRPEAAEALRNVPLRRFPGDFQAQASGAAEAALEAHQQIAEDGLAEYYKKARMGSGG